MDEHAEPPREPHVLPPPTLLRAAYVFYGVTAMGAYAYAFFFGDTTTLLGEATATGRDLGTGIALGLGIVLFCHGLYRISPYLRRASDALGALLGPIAPAQGILLGVVSGFSEELLFRGALWEHLGLWGSSLLFGLLHFIPVRALAFYPIFAFLAGVGMGVLRERTGSIWPPVATHVTVNAINLSFLGWMQRKSYTGPLE